MLCLTQGTSCTYFSLEKQLLLYAVPSYRVMLASGATRCYGPQVAVRFLVIGTSSQLQLFGCWPDMKTLKHQLFLHVVIMIFKTHTIFRSFRTIPTCFCRCNTAKYSNEKCIYFAWYTYTSTITLVMFFLLQIRQVTPHS